VRIAPISVLIMMTVVNVVSISDTSCGGCGVNLLWMIEINREYLYLRGGDQLLVISITLLLFFYDYL